MNGKLNEMELKTKFSDLQIPITDKQNRTEGVGLSIDGHVASETNTAEIYSIHALEKQIQIINGLISRDSKYTATKPPNISKILKRKNAQMCVFSFYSVSKLLNCVLKRLSS